MRFRILGPLSVRDGDRELTVTAGRDRVVLALLLLHGGRIVGIDDLVDAVWGEQPPATARGQLQTCVSRLRRALPAGVIRTDPAGYAVSLGEDDLDATVFVRLVAEARRSGDPDDARQLFRTALGLWRGDALVGLDSRAVRQRAAVLDEQRVVAIEDWFDRELDAGRDRDLVAELTGLVEQHPLRERLRAQLMLTLYRVGRQADALAEYRRARELLSRELGIEPGAALRDMHRRLLTGDVLVPATRVEGPVNALPRAVGDFTGRREVVERILRSIESAGPGQHIEVVDGMAGCGKTTLAVHLAGLVRDRYQDAQLFIDLQGQSEKSALEPAEALVTLLHQLGLPADRIPEALDERIMLWRTELAARRTVLILDNAASTAQVDPLLPTDGMALTLVTSRRRLIGLDGIHPESIGVLAEDEATALLAAIAGDRVGREPVAAAEVVRRCGALPLAIRLAGARLAHRPRWQVGDLARRLSESALPELAAEDRTVTGAFAVSYGQLAGPVQRTFRLLGRQPVQHFGVLSVAALTGMSVDDTQDQLDDLVDMHLVEEPGPGRYRLHDLLREFAGTLAAPASERDAALSGLIDLHLQVSTAIARSQEHGVADGDFPAESPRRPDLLAVAVDDPSWFEAQRPYLRALMVAAADVGEHRRGWQLARSSWRFLFLAAYNDDLIAVMNLGLEIAAAAGDERGIAVMRNYLASGYYRIGRYADAARQLAESLEYQIRIGNRSGEALLRGNLGGVLISMGRLTEAYALEVRSYAIYRELQNVAGLTSRLFEMAEILLILGRDTEALAMVRRALQCAVELRHPMSIAVALSYVGQTRLRLGAIGPAERLLTAALRLARKVGYRVGEAEMINQLGRLAVAQGRFPEAVQRHLAARQMVQEQGARRSVAQFSNDLAVALRAMGDVPGALDLHRHALTMARNLAHGYEEGRALSGIAACLATDDPVAARRHLQQALVIFTRMGVADRHDVEQRLQG